MNSWLKRHVGSKIERSGYIRVRRAEPNRHPKRQSQLRQRRETRRETPKTYLATSRGRSEAGIPKLQLHFAHPSSPKEMATAQPPGLRGNSVGIRAAALDRRNFYRPERDIELKENSPTSDTTTKFAFCALQRFYVTRKWVVEQEMKGGPELIPVVSRRAADAARSLIRENQTPIHAPVDRGL